MTVKELIELLREHPDDTPVKLIVSDGEEQKQGEVEDVFYAVSAVVVCGYESR